MDVFQVSQALKDVRALRHALLEKQVFRGYSSRARIVGGVLALLAGALGYAAYFQTDPERLFYLWGTVFVLAALVNYGAIGLWVIGNRRTQASADLSFLLENVPVFFVGGVLSLALWNSGNADLLYGTWMALFGLSQCVARARLPRQIVRVGMLYIACGALALLLPVTSFSQPIFMGAVFFTGECLAGLILHAQDQPAAVTTRANPE